jgi:hypothetical protein
MVSLQSSLTVSDVRREGDPNMVGGEPMETHRRAGTTLQRERSGEGPEGSEASDRPPPPAAGRRHLPATLRVVPLPTPGTTGATATRMVTFDVSHPYVEKLWVPLLGPTQVILLRRLSEAARPDGGVVDVAELAVAIGTRPAPDGTVGRRSPLAKAIARLNRFRLAAWPPGDAAPPWRSPPASPPSTTATFAGSPTISSTSTAATSTRSHSRDGRLWAAQVASTSRSSCSRRTGVAEELAVTVMIDPTPARQGSLRHLPAARTLGALRWIAFPSSSGGPGFLGRWL